jgi:Fe-S cluster assembly protein SufD
MSTVESPDWLADVRRVAAGQLPDIDAPSDESEVWRYSRINDVDLDRFNRPAHTSSEIDPVVPADAAATVVIRDGFITELSTRDIDGLTVTAASDHPDGRTLFAKLRGPADDAVSALHDASISGVVMVDVARGAHIDGPIVIDTYSDVEDGLVAPHTLIRCANGGSVNVLERRRSGAATQLVLPIVEIHAAPDARVGYVVVQDLGAQTTSLEQLLGEVDQQGHVTMAVAAFGGHYARTRADLRLIGRGASGDLLSAFFGDGDQMLDFRTFQDHLAPDTTSTLLFKGAVTGAAQSVYSGLIRVDETAPGTNAFQTNRNLKLSDDAWAYSVPNLEIEQNQVSCSHASTVGEIDEAQRFYLESRGVPADKAEQLLVSGFFAEVIGQMPIDGIHVELQQRIDAAVAADRQRQEQST